MLGGIGGAAVRETKGTSLRRGVAKVEKSGYDLHGTRCERVPLGFDPERKNASCLLHEGLYAGTDLRLPDSIETTKFVAFCMGHYQKLIPLYRWIAAM